MKLYRFSRILDEQKWNYMSFPGLILKKVELAMSFFREFSLKNVVTCLKKKTCHLSDFSGNPQIYTLHFFVIHLPIRN